MGGTALSRTTVSVVVASVGRPEDLRDCLKSVAAQAPPPDEVIVVAQVQDRATIAVAQEAEARVAVVHQPGLALALETGMRAATMEVLAFLDDDARAKPGWLRTIVAHFDSQPRLGLLGGRDNVYGDNFSGGRRVPVGLVRRGKIVGNHHLGKGTIRHVSHVKGANMSMRSSAVRAIPLARLVTGTGAQVRNEFILSLSVQAGGFIVAYDPGVQVDHYPSERAAGDERARIDAGKIFTRRSNESAAFAYVGDACGWLMFVLRALLLGDRSAPGLALILLSRRGSALVRASALGIGDGLRRGRATRLSSVRRSA